jgi:hypothetical protein
MDEFCPNKPGYERCYSCMKNFQPIGEKGSCSRVCGDEVHVGSCSLTENAQLKVDYVWTCQYKRVGAGCCQTKDSCSDGSSPATCTGAGATFHMNTCCSDVTACSGGCCKYSDNSCSGGVSSRACTMAANSTGWTLGSCPPYPECIPEPATVLLVLSGLGAAGLYLRRRRAR